MEFLFGWFFFACLFLFLFLRGKHNGRRVDLGEKGRECDQCALNNNNKIKLKKKEFELDLELKMQRNHVTGLGLVDMSVTPRNYSFAC